MAINWQPCRGNASDPRQLLRSVASKSTAFVSSTKLQLGQIHSLDREPRVFGLEAEGCRKVFCWERLVCFPMRENRSSTRLPAVSTGFPRVSLEFRLSFPRVSQGFSRGLNLMRCSQASVSIEMPNELPIDMQLLSHEARPGLNLNSEPTAQGA